MSNKSVVFYEYKYEISPLFVEECWEFVCIWVHPKEKFEYWIFRRVLG